VNDGTLAAQPGSVSALPHGALLGTHHGQATAADRADVSSVGCRGLLSPAAAASTRSQVDTPGLVATLGRVLLCCWLGGVAVAMLVARAQLRSEVCQLS
jgi:hypothetical protein